VFLDLTFVFRIDMPRLLLFSDVHGDQEACRQLVAQADEADVVVGAGDFCVMRRNLQAPIDTLSAIETPTVLVPGNAESEEELQAACADWPSARVLHGAGCTIDGQSFYGIGGGIPVTPFGPWSYDFSEGEAEAMLADCPAGAVLVSHSPPKGAVDRDSSGQSLGSTAVRAVIEDQQPALTVCGHIHGSWGQDAELAGTPVVNAGPDGLLWDVER
jgi:Icc-related predicted phosphoesterase